MTKPLDPFSEVVDVRRRWTVDWYGWLDDLAKEIASGGGGITSLTTDVVATGPGTSAATIQADVVTNPKLANMAQSTLKGRAVGAGTGDPTDLTPAQGIAVLGVREPLQANRDYYVRTDGSDSNAGLVNSAGGAFLTVQKAIIAAYGLIDLRGFDCTIHVGAGTFTQELKILAPQVGAGNITIDGAGTGSTTLTSTSGPTLYVIKNAVVTVSNLKVACAGAICIAAQSSGIVYGGGSLAFGGATFAHLYVAQYGTISFASIAYSIDADVPYHMNANGTGYMTITNSTVTIPAARTFTIWAVASNLAYLETAGATYTGTGAGAGSAGKKFSAVYNSVIATNGNTTGMPGNVAGTADATSVFY